MRVEITDLAETDLEQGYLFYEQQQVGLGTYFLDALYSDIDSLCFYGGIHLKLWGYHRLLSKHFPFAVYYYLVEDTVLVMAILDCRRNPSWIRKKLMAI
jgi:plasmid stabilization system protein ParE